MRQEKYNKEELKKTVKNNEKRIYRTKAFNTVTIQKRCH